MSVVAGGARLAESLMTDTFTAYSPAGRTKVNGLEVPAFDSQGETVGKVQGGSAATADPSSDYEEIRNVRRPVLRAGLHIPVTAPVPVAGDAGVGWEYECTAVGPSSEPSLLGRRYRVVNAPAKSYATARRLDVVEV